MEFCQKCGGIIEVKEGKAICASCGHRLKKAPKIQTSERIEKAEAVAVVKELESNVYPEIQMTCPQCKNKKAYFWTTQTRASDESETKFYKCTKCEHTWRKYR